ncbi:hypothetical protein AAA799N04_01636 [Marine Group I thaumarchaeote SCGC AAA799-N04]|uniref:Uncharacterized protein n=1 Tax=Marine Group I thaumarchaeote SCGC AAA799-N04 TaxID=1502293 RepID=A0A081RL83_9ARCH|nr:hypothetical protein AAA799N04_01636 [Marine Group I thaumarchaeote SCGC AAA799-N04]
MFPIFIWYSNAFVILSYNLTSAEIPVTSNVLMILSSGSLSEYFAISLLCARYSESSPASLINRFAFFSSTCVFHHKSKKRILFEISEPNFDILVINDVASSDWVSEEYERDAYPPILLIFSEISST